MFEKISTDKKDVIIISAKGTITPEDYNTVLIPTFEKLHAEGHKARILVQFGPEFKGYTVAAGWEDFKFGMHYLTSFERCALVTDIAWIKNVTKMFLPLIPCPAKIFANNQIDEAKAWIQSKDMHLSYDLDKATGVLKVEISAPLTADDFEALALKVDPWIQKNGKLNGIVIHANHFPGWKDLGSMIQHISFVKNHHQKVARVALCADGICPELAPIVAKHFVDAEIKQFDYKNIADALAWVSTKGTHKKELEQSRAH
ncbi:MAG: STAS/SEC14 domain-containing protein [Bdellovibrionaceae bacterium]|nr:STAS/SEC14 domain-containing protein [Pseudobdellovibrionaceae bacterium]